MALTPDSIIKQVQGLDASWCVLRQVLVKDEGGPTTTKIVAKTARPNCSGASGAKAVNVDLQTFRSLAEATDFQFISFDDLDTYLWIEKLMQGRRGEEGPYTWVHIAEVKDSLGKRIGGEISILANLRHIFEEILETGFCSRYAYECRWRFVSLETPFAPRPETLTDLSINSVEIDGIRSVPSPAAFSIPLLPHQCRSLSWMLHREKAEDLFVCEVRRCEPVFVEDSGLSLEVLMDQAFDIRGGLLCDPVGSGKTASIISLIWETQSACKEHACNTTSRLPPIPATLVLSPANVHQHWIDEVQKFCNELKVLAIPTVERLRDTSREALTSHDIVLVPYEVLLQPSYNDLASPWKKNDSTSLSPRAPASAREKVAPRPKRVCVGRSSARTPSPKGSPPLASVSRVQRSASPVQQSTRGSFQGPSGEDSENGIGNATSVSNIGQTAGVTPNTASVEQMRFAATRNSLGCFYWYRVVMDEFHELGAQGTTHADQFRRSTLCQLLRMIQSAMRWGLSGTPDAFVVRLVHAARLFQCEITPLQAPTFLEHFCRRGRIQIDVKIEEHHCPVIQTGAERALYLVYQREAGVPEEGLTWEASQSFGDSIRQLIRCCTHFAAPTNLSDSISADATSHSLLARKHVLLGQAQENYLDLLQRSWKIALKRRTDLISLSRALQEKVAILNGLRDTEKAKRVANKIELLMHILKGRAPPNPPHESEVEVAFRNQMRSVPHEPEQPSAKIKVDISVSVRNADLDQIDRAPWAQLKDARKLPKVRVEEIGGAREWLWRNDADFQGVVSPREKETVTDAADPITAFVTFCYGMQVVRDAIPGLWTLEEDIKQLTGTLSDYGEQLYELNAKCEEHQKAIDFHEQVQKALKGLDENCGTEACPICMEDLTPVNTCLPRCAHPICEDCLQRLAATFKCPICRSLTNRSEVLRVYPKTLTEEMETDTKPDQISWASVLLAAGNNKVIRTFVDRHELLGGADLKKWQDDMQKSVEGLKVEQYGGKESLCRTWGSKFQCVISTIAEVRESDPFAKIILFLQWEDLRKRLSRALLEAKVPHVVLHGTVFERTRALQQFQNDRKLSLMLLSLEDSASGTNLTCASHVFLFHPMLANTLEEASAAEAQAIGRVRRLGQKRKVHVWRFYTKCSVEESLWNLVEGSRTALRNETEDGYEKLNPEIA